MESIRKQASKLREQVARQQQAVLRQLGHFASDFGIADEAEIECHEQLQHLYNSTRVAKHFQRNIVRNVESFVSISTKQLELVKKLAEDCCRYGNENQSSNALANAAFEFGASHKSMEEEMENFVKILDSQVSEPLRASIVGAPLDDARHLTHRYDRIRQEVDAQAAEVRRRQLKSVEAGSTSEVNAIKLKNAEMKLEELKSTMMALGKEATAAMLSVEDQQQRLTFQRILTMVNAERSYHRSAVDSLEQLYAEMIISKQQIETASEPAPATTDVYVPPAPADSNSDKFDDVEPGIHSSTSFIAEVIHPFDAQADGELGLCVGDYIVVRRVTPHGWSEGEHMGKAGWFPSAYVEKRDIAPVSKVTELAS
ncbi:SH3 domain-containing protein 2-like [Papaver somniferum]|uniref:SH3 domain-containing protein 2-like n=1 Tax=Papaver somniferum TaxID=3469 RepID=UPI000E6FFE2D|nr:SH3 domain-containing protein 2-like [Papaver somniferum]